MSERSPRTDLGILQCRESLSASPWREWWVFYIDPTLNDHQWRAYGCIGGRNTADEAILKTVGMKFDRPFWAFALDRGDKGSYYDLHYPVGRENPHDGRIGPSGYVAVSE